MALEQQSSLSPLSPKIAALLKATKTVVEQELSEPVPRFHAPAAYHEKMLELSSAREKAYVDLRAALAPFRGRP